MTAGDWPATAPQPLPYGRDNDCPGESGVECAITYILVTSGLVYLMAVIDWFIRSAVSWATSITMDVAFCLEALDNVFVERLWRRGKYEEVYVRDYQSAWDARHSWARFFVFYHEERLHQAWGYRTPAAVYP